jgi:hypothetical protein
LLVGVSLPSFGEGKVRQLPLDYQVYIVSCCRKEEVSKKLKRQRGSIFSVASNAGEKGESMQKVVLNFFRVQAKCFP